MNEWKVDEKSGACVGSPTGPVVTKARLMEMLPTLFLIEENQHGDLRKDNEQRSEPLLPGNS